MLIMYICLIIIINWFYWRFRTDYVRRIRKSSYNMWMIMINVYFHRSLKCEFDWIIIDVVKILFIQYQWKGFLFLPPPKNKRHLEKIYKIFFSHFNIWFSRIHLPPNISLYLSRSDSIYVNVPYCEKTYKHHTSNRMIVTSLFIHL